MPSLTQLEYALAVEKFRHFGKAARASAVTQPTLSMQLKKLEEELGVAIFDRTKKPILLTEAGKLVIESARLIVAETKRLTFRSRPENREVTGRFKLAVIPTLAPYVIPLFVERFSKRSENRAPAR